MRVLVCGPPDWTDSATVKTVLDWHPPDEVIHNDSATGVDAAAAEWCAANSVPEVVVPVDGTKGASAEQLNIEAMLALGPDLVRSFAVMDPDNPEAVPQLLATDMAFAAGFAIDFSIIDTRVYSFDDEDPLDYKVCSLCGLSIKQVFLGEAEPHWSTLAGDAVCASSTDVRPDHVPILPVEDSNPQPPLLP